MATKTYTAVVGLNYPTAKGEVRVEAGEPCLDLPTKSVAWLRDQGLIKAGKGKAAAEDTEVAADEEPVDAGEETD